MKSIASTPLEDAEYQKLNMLKAKLGCTTWRELIMKLAKAYEQTCAPLDQTAQPEPETQTAKPEGPMTKLWRDLGSKTEPTQKEGKKPMDEEELSRLIRKCIRQELEDHEFKFETPQPQPQPAPAPKPEYDECLECGSKTVPKDAKHCPECGTEFDDSEDEEE